MKNLLLLLSILLTVHISYANFPELSNFEINPTHPNRIYFESSEEITGSTITGFDLRDYGGITIIGISINTAQLSGHYFTVSTPFTWYHNNTLKYDGGSNIQGVSDALPNFDLQYIQNNIPIPNVTGTVYFVDASVSTSGNGLSESNAFKTIQEGVNILTAGDKLWIKAGNYGAENVSCPHNVSGTVNSPIVIEGYKSTPGDITSLYYTYGSDTAQTSNPFLSSEMPLLDGGNRDNGTGFSMGETVSYYVVKNLQIQNYSIGFGGNISSEKILLERILTKNMGVDASDSGYGILLDVYTLDLNYFRITDCIVINATQYNFSIAGNNNLFENCKSYCDEYNPNNHLGISTDYYIIVQGENNILRNCLVNKRADEGHVGHGYALKYKNEHTLVEFSKAINIGWPFQSRHSVCNYNVFRNCESHADVSYRRYDQYDSFSGGIDLNSGAHHNIYDRIYIHNVDTAFSFIKSLEDNANSTDIGHDNIFRNIIVDDIEHVGIVIRNFEPIQADFANNKFYNITINDSREFFFIIKTTNGGNGGVNSFNNEIKNCSFSDVPTLSANNLNYTPPTGFIWDYNNFFNSFPSQGSNTISANPMFVDATSRNFHLQNNSPLIDSGTNLSNVIFDFENNQRSNASGYDIGAYENQFDSTASIEEINIIDNTILLYPNPSTGIIKIRLSVLEKTSLKLVSLNGRIVYQKEINNPKNIEHVDFNEIEKGVYFIKISNQNKTYIKKIILF